MAMNKDHFHTHGPDELAMLRAECDKWHKAYDRVWEERMRFADRAIELEKENKELKEERRWRKFPDEKPKHNGIFIVLIGKRTKTLDAYDTDKGKFQTYRPTAWMPLPKAPEDK